MSDDDDGGLNLWHRFNECSNENDETLTIAICTIRRVSTSCSPLLLTCHCVSWRRRSGDDEREAYGGIVVIVLSS